MTLLVTQNLPGRVPKTKRKSHLKAITKGLGADVAVLQEGAWMTETDVPVGYQWLHGADTALNILVASKHVVTGTMDQCAFSATEVGQWGAGPATLKPGWDFGVRIDLNGNKEDRVWVFDAHLVPSAGRKKPTDPEERKNWELRNELHLLEAEQLADMTVSMVARGERVAIGGDFNAATRNTHFKSLVETGFRGVSRATHGPHQIDHWWLANARAKKVSKQEAPGDHDTLIVEI